ncbi:MAG TPA: hypothetical protein VGK89_13940 [Candidatus Eisenbacteria bacterium]|jgi:hypothetical protein
MNEASPLKAWESFYVIVGSSAGALTGLQFVVLTLIGEAGGIRGRGDSIAAFGSPNVVHFCAALLVAAVLSAPWGGLGPAGVALAVTGAAGVLYSIAVLRRAMRQGDYEPVLEDWIWHAALPMLAYAALVYAGLALQRNQADTLYVVGAAVLLLVFIGIHNAWDTVMYVMTRGIPEQRPGRTPPKAATPGAAGKKAEPPPAS